MLFGQQLVPWTSLGAQLVQNLPASAGDSRNAGSNPGSGRSPGGGNDNLLQYSGFPGGSEGKEFACNAGDWSLIPVLGRSTREGNGNPLQYSCLENSTHRGTSRLVLGVTKELDTPEQVTLSD